MKQPLPLELKKELMLQINQRLFEQGLLAQETYAEAKVKIVNIRTYAPYRTISAGCFFIPVAGKDHNGFRYIIFII